MRIDKEILRLCGCSQDLAQILGIGWLIILGFDAVAGTSHKLIFSSCKVGDIGCLAGCAKVPGA